MALLANLATLTAEDRVVKAGTFVATDETRCRAVDTHLGHFYTDTPDTDLTHCN